MRGRRSDILRQLAQYWNGPHTSTGTTQCMDNVLIGMDCRFDGRVIYCSLELRNTRSENHFAYVICSAFLGEQVAAHDG